MKANTSKQDSRFFFEWISAIRKLLTKSTISTRKVYTKSHSRELIFFFFFLGKSKLSSYLIVTNSDSMIKSECAVVRLTYHVTFYIQLPLTDWTPIAIRSALKYHSEPNQRKESCYIAMKYASKCCRCCWSYILFDVDCCNTINACASFYVWPICCVENETLGIRFAHNEASYTEPLSVEHESPLRSSEEKVHYHRTYDSCSFIIVFTIANLIYFIREPETERCIAH